MKTYRNRLQAIGVISLMLALVGILLMIDARLKGEAPEQWLYWVTMVGVLGLLIGEHLKRMEKRIRSLEGEDSKG